MFQYSTLPSFYFFIFLFSQDPPHRSGGGTAKDDDDHALVSADESQFAAVLRMRNCDLLQALHRAQKFVRRLRRSPSVPAGVQPLKMALALGRWYFESLTLGLVELRGADVDQGERYVEQGERLMRKGEQVVEQGIRSLNTIEEYRSNGKHALRPAVTGRAYVDQITRQIVEGETVVAQGEEIKREGVLLLEKGFTLMPRIPKKRSLKRYFEKQVQLATFQSCVPPEMFETDDHDGGGSAGSHMHDDELVETEEQHKTKATTESSGMFLLAV